MANAALQLMGFALAFLGSVGMIASIAMVQWKASSYVGDNIITAQALYQGLWMTCASQSTGQVQCKQYDSLLQLPAEIQVTRALMLVGILMSFFAILVESVGMKCTTCLGDNKQQKNKVALAGGVMFIVGGFCALLGTCMYANRIAQDFYSPFTPTNGRYEFGGALFVGWAAAALAMIGGGFLCCNCRGGAAGKSPRYPQARPAGPPGKDFV
ncbi:claudin-1 [Denticeps clupeoides]|uniref:claudin-1 n=1 Tax=Denticeps clupeoides TaxID=299321 RepID=UPI0010A43C47|nr:claudin-1-like [Denticeps clupeoides]